MSGKQSIWIVCWICSRSLLRQKLFTFGVQWAKMEAKTYKRIGHFLSHSKEKIG